MDKITQLLQTIEQLKTEIENDHKAKLVELTNANKEHLETLAKIKEENTIKEEIAKMKQDIDIELALIEKEKVLDQNRKLALEKKEKEYQAQLLNIQNLLKS